ncbi:MAG TPA: hypothetical protein EYP10_05225, partial [Armatimonadetes bacterium]|nr:hypothetical protein [Armatimonadota bacterium]
MMMVIAIALLVSMRVDCNTAIEERFYVAVNGNDKWSGKLPEPSSDGRDGPFATLHRAQQAIRELKAMGVWRPITIFIRGGTYFLTEPLTFTPEDSGTTDCPITFTAYRNERVIISGGRRITNWRKIRTTSQSKGGVAPDYGLWATYLPEVKAGRWFFRIMRVGNDWAIRARYPNFDPEHPLTGGWLFARWWGEPWERGAFNVGVGNIHNVGDRLEWRIAVPADGEYRVWVRYAHNMKHFGVDAMDDRTIIRINDGEPVPLRNLPDTGGWNNFRWTLVATFKLHSGEQTLIWEN